MSMDFVTTERRRIALIQASWWRRLLYEVRRCKVCRGVGKFCKWNHPAETTDCPGCAGVGYTVRNRITGQLA